MKGLTIEALKSVWHGAINIDGIRSVFDLLPLSGSAAFMTICQAGVPITGTDFDFLIKGGSVLGFVVIAIKYLMTKNSGLTEDVKVLNAKMLEIHGKKVELLERKLESYERKLEDYEKSILEAKIEKEQLKAKVSILEGK